MERIVNDLELKLHIANEEFSDLMYIDLPELGEQYFFWTASNLQVTEREWDWCVLVILRRFTDVQLVHDRLANHGGFLDELPLIDAIALAPWQLKMFYYLQVKFPGKYAQATYKETKPTAV